MKILAYTNILKNAYKNWMQLSLLMGFFKLGLIKNRQEIGIMRSGGKVIGDYYQLFSYALTYNTLVNCNRGINALINLFGCKNFSLDCEKISEIIAEGYISIGYQNTKLKFKLYYPKNNSIEILEVIKQSTSIYPILEVFCKEAYSILDVKDSIVIDIGAFIADSSIYFAVRGAKRVIGLEPNPFTYSLALENVKINGLENIVTVLNAGYGKDEVLRIKDQRVSGRDVLSTSNKDNTIELLSLSTIISKFNLEGRLLLKMDCEGCEYNLINEDHNTLRKFSQIVMEYHHGYEELKKLLEKLGFEVYIKPTSKSSGYLSAKKRI